MRGWAGFSCRHPSRVSLITEATFLLISQGVLAGIFAGTIGGTLSGLAGLGGGVIYMPILYLLLTEGGEGAAAAVMTSLIAVFFTGLFSSYTHWRLHHVDKTLSHNFVPWLVAGATTGLWITLKISETMILLGLVVLDMWIIRDLGHSYSRKKNPAGQHPVGVLIGFISGILGIGGGTMLVPVLRRFVALRHAVGTAAFCGTVMAGLAVMINLMVENRWPQLMQGQLVLAVSFLAGVLLVLSPSSRLAAAMHQSCPEPQIRLILRIIFAFLALFLLILGLVAM